MEFIKVVKQELFEKHIKQTLENGDVLNVPYLIDDSGNKYCETDPDLIKVSVH